MSNEEFITTPKTRQEFYDALNLLHTWALDNLEEVDMAPVVEAIEIGMNCILTSCPDVSA